MEDPGQTSPQSSDSVGPRADDSPFGEIVSWAPQVPRYTIPGLLLSWFVAGAAVFLAALIVPGMQVERFRDALVAAVLIAALNAILPPLVAAINLPFTLALGFPIILLIDAAILMLTSTFDPNGFRVDSFGWALARRARDRRADDRDRGPPRRQR